MPHDKSKTKTMVETALIFAVATVLSAAESALPPLFPALPGVKFGLSNIAVMYTLFFIGKKSAFAMAVLKSVFIFAVKGLSAGVLSLLGGVLSVAVMAAIIAVFKANASYTSISIFGAVSHNIGQIMGVWILYKGMFLTAYLPVLIIAGVAAGILTATLLRLALPALKKIGRG